MTWNTDDEKNYVELMESRFELEGKSPLGFFLKYLKQWSNGEYSTYSVKASIDINELRSFVYQKVRKHLSKNFKKSKKILED